MVGRLIEDWLPEIDCVASNRRIRFETPVVDRTGVVYDDGWWFGESGYLLDVTGLSDDLFFLVFQ